MKRLDYPEIDAEEEKGKERLISYRQYQNMRRKGLHPVILAEYQDEKKVLILERKERKMRRL